MRAGALVLVGVALAASGGAVPSAWHTFGHEGLTVRYPPSWYATATALTPVTSPSQVLALASYPLPTDATGADGCCPREALDRLPPTGAFVFAWEYGDLRLPGLRTQDFSPRPKHLALSGFARWECLGPSYMLRFREQARFLEVHVAFGRRATAATRWTVLRVLDSLRVARR